LADFVEKLERTICDVGNYRGWPAERTITNGPALRTKRAFGWRGFFWRREIPYSMVMAFFANRTNKHGGSSANPPAASLNGEHNIIATNAS
jgi:hypothetical protein